MPDRSRTDYSIFNTVIPISYHTLSKNRPGKGTFPFASHPFNLTLNNAPTQVYFSPNRGCTEVIIRKIDLAKKEILVQPYSFTSQPIAKDLLGAHKRGVKVQDVMVKSQRSKKYTSATFLANVGIPTYIDPAHFIAHNKVMVIDREIVIRWSFNFTRQLREKR